ncbi:MAG: hypothetical protein IJG13_13755 [Kiritimatiellae bacterium]|nr:hypothetical protein [Kiritimatiellia bacterium]
MSIKNIVAALALAISLAANAAEKRWLGTDATSPTLASVAANWDPAGAPTADDDVVLDAGSNNNPMTWDLDNGVASWTQSDYTGTVTFKTGKTASYSSNTYTAYGVTQADGSKSFTISGNLTLSSGTWTHAATPAMTSTSAGDNLYKQGTGVYRLQVSVGGNCTIGSGAAIDVTAKGFTGANSYYGPGYASNMASHGGMGSYQSVGGFGRAQCYGSVARPQTIGTARSSIGGGNVQLEVAGALTLDGGVLAKSGTTANYSGSGGGIFIHARSISGSGIVSASSGTVSNLDPGGGGRVAIWVDEGDFSNFPVDNVTANAGNGHALSTAGTVFLWAKSDATFGARLIVRGNASVTTTQANYRYSCTPISVANTNDMPALTAIVLSNGANLAIDKGVSLDVGTIQASQTGTAKPRFTMFGGSLVVPDGFMVDGFNFRVYDDGASIDVAGQGSMSLASENSLVIDRPFAIDGSLFVTGTVTHTQVSATSTNILDLTVSGDMEIVASGLIDVSAKGFPSKSGPGGATAEGMGGVHAGMVPGSSKHAYGSIVCPTNHGSGGGMVNGGGVVKLTVGGTFTLDGTIRAYASNNNGGGNGSGGSVWVTAGELAGAGSIDAKGGSYGLHATVSPLAGAGGTGGRISIWQTVGNKARSEWAVTTTIAGGSSNGGTTSAAGTFYWQKALDGVGGGTVSTGAGSETAAPEVPSSSFAEPNELSGATLSVGSGNFLFVTDDITVGDFRLPAASTVCLDGHVLTVTNPAKRKSQSVLGTIAGGTIDDIVWPQRGFMLFFR